MKDTLRESGFFSSSLLFVHAIIVLFQIHVIKYGNPLLDDSQLGPVSVPHIVYYLKSLLPVYHGFSTFQSK